MIESNPQNKHKMNFKLTFLLIFVYQISIAQVFVEATNNSFIEWPNASIAFADVDGDDDQDILILGYLSTQTMGKIYLNDGLGNYTLGPQPPFPGKFFSTIDLADIDGDNDLDVLFTGTLPGVGAETNLYVNNGNGIFTELTTNFINVTSGDAAFADVDGDNDQDVLITGKNDANECHTKLYLNDGTGTFEEVVNGPFISNCSSAVEFADIDGDLDLDVLITGTGDLVSQANLYQNDGGIFTLMMQDDISSVTNSNISFFDVDQDGDQDLITTGIQGSEVFTKLYLNDGSGSFSEDVNSDFVNSNGRGHAIGDIDGDADLDIIITGQTSLQQPTTRSTNLYLNNGNGIFSDVVDNPFVETNGKVLMADVDGDADLDVLVAGYDGTTGVTRLYINETVVNTTQPFINDRLEFSIHPNPMMSGNSINVEAYSNYNKKFTILIYDVLGRIVENIETTLLIGDNQFSIDGSKLEKGNYFVQFKYDDQILIKKLLTH